jgi:hypothetical protein
MDVAVFAGLVDIEGVVGMFEGGNTKPLADQQWDEMLQERCLAGTAPACEAY